MSNWATETHQRLHELYTIVLGRVVGRGNHDSDPFSFQGTRAEGSDETDTGQDRVEHLTEWVRGEEAVDGRGGGAFLRLCTELHADC